MMGWGAEVGTLCWSDQSCSATEVEVEDTGLKGLNLTDRGAGTGEEQKLGYGGS